MAYKIEFYDKGKKHMDKICKKNPLLEEALRKKIREIAENPYYYKPLKYDLFGERRVHIMKSFVIKYAIDEANKTIKFLLLEHHDEAYKR